MSDAIDQPPAPTPDEIYEVVSDSVLKLWEVVNSLTQLRPRRLQFYYVTIFGSARLLPGTPEYAEVRELASELAKMPCRIVTGGGPGLMQAANAGALQADPTNKESSIGIRIDLPLEQGVNSFVGHAYSHKTFFTRLHHFVLISDAFVVMPGGIGTTLETAMIWQLLQVRGLYNTPLILVGPMWRDFVDWARVHMVERTPPLAAPVDMTIPRCVGAVAEAVALIRDHRRLWDGQDKFSGV